MLWNQFRACEIGNNNHFHCISQLLKRFHNIITDRTWRKANKQTCNGRQRVWSLIWIQRTSIVPVNCFLLCFLYLFKLILSANIVELLLCFPSNKFIGGGIVLLLSWLKYLSQLKWFQAKLFAKKNKTKVFGYDIQLLPNSPFSCWFLSRKLVFFFGPQHRLYCFFQNNDVQSKKWLGFI